MEKEQVQTKINLLFIIWLAIMTATFVYGAVIFFAKNMTYGNLVFNRISITICSIAFLNILIGYFVYSKIEGMLSKSPQKDLDTLFGKMMTLNIMSWALIESSCVLALVLSFLTKNGSFYLTIAPVALAMMLIAKPKPLLIRNILT